MVRSRGPQTDEFPPSAGLCPDWDSWDASKPVNNAREAMQQADDWLGIPQVRPSPWQVGSEVPVVRGGVSQEPQAWRPTGSSLCP